MKIYDLLLNKIYPKIFSFIYKIGFINFGKKSKILFPRVVIEKKYLNISNNVFIGKNARIQSYPNNKNSFPVINIYENVSIQYNLSILAGDDITIEKDVLIASNVSILSENHSINPELKGSYVKQDLNVKNVTIKEGAWIGENVCILPGVIIGKKSIVGAMSVVTKSIPDYSIAVGNPAKIIKKYNFLTHKWENIKIANKN